MLNFYEEALEGDTVLKYDPYYSGSEVLTDEFGNKVLPFTFAFPVEPDEPVKDEPVDSEEPADEEPVDPEKPEEISPVSSADVPVLESEENETATEPEINQSSVEVSEEKPVNEPLSDETDATEIEEANLLLNAPIRLIEENENPTN